ncbi:Hdr-like menaquinol oxidoreductase iron-sulfur subunit 1 precursor [Thermoplasmatales archaeon]|nr:Hdr-like menaquinol oxidoreductase iron-sulfur subunit 1 precursor [Thermoplasmatales archaeon]
MRVKAQIAMVMNLDKCIGCHTCSVTCKNVWTNRPGTEYMWFNNVETRPGPGYPTKWEDQDRYKGGWVVHNGKLRLRSGGPMQRLLNIFYNPDLPLLDDYYEPWNYSYENLIESDRKEHQPVARPYSLVTGKNIEKPSWGPNWNDDLAGGSATSSMDPNVRAIQEHIAYEYEKSFMIYLPRICEHCLNPACVAACPAGAIYKRDEDGIVLVDQESCRGWRFCVTACPYKKVYFNWKTHKSEKCTFCYPRIEAGLPTVCSETCVGRIRYLGPILYDSDRIKEAASVENPKNLYESQLSVFLDPFDPEVIANASKEGINDAWIKAAQDSPVYKMAVKWKVALPLHPEFRTLPMVWYVPPLSPILNTVEGESEISANSYIPLVDSMRIPIEYLSSILTAGNVEITRSALLKLSAMRAYMRSIHLESEGNNLLLKETGMTSDDVIEMSRLFGVSKYNERFVIPTAMREMEQDASYLQGACSLEGIAPEEGMPRPKQRR